jgi:hypothetical protein
VLYYVGTVADLENIAAKIARSLEKEILLFINGACSSIIDDPSNPDLISHSSEPN